MSDSKRLTLLPLTAGPLTMMFDTKIAYLRYVRFEEQELVRGVFAAVRDRDWNTIPFSIDDLSVDQTSDRFSIHFNANSLNPNIAFQWQGTIEGTNEGVVRYCFKGKAVAPFLRNRIGLCVLHPSGEWAGKPCQIEHVDGSITHERFPLLISPHQPFKDVRAISHDLQHGGQVRVTMSGERFETEDQRNWTDASFKTYSTPLDLPFPVRVERGTIIEQSVSIELLGTERPLRLRKGVHCNRCQVDIDWTQPIRRPKMGFQWPKPCQTTSQKIVDRLHAIRPDHLRVDLWLNQSDWRGELASAIEIAQSIETKLEFALFANSVKDTAWRECMNRLQPAKSRIARLLLFHTTDKTTPTDLASHAFHTFREIDPTIQIAVGTNAYFAELNRDRPKTIEDCLVCYSINPQVHAFDNLSLSETLEAQRATVDSAAETFGTGVVVSPVTLRPRFNPNATSAIDTAVELESAIDPRQSSGFGAAWTAGVFASLLTHPKVDSLTIYEAFGPRGIVGINGDNVPMTSLIEYLLQMEQTFRGISSLPMGLVAFGMQSADEMMHVVFGNLSNEDIDIQFLTKNGNERVITIAAESARIESIKEESVDA